MASTRIRVYNNTKILELDATIKWAGITVSSASNIKPGAYADLPCEYWLYDLFVPFRFAAGEGSPEAEKIELKNVIYGKPDNVELDNADIGTSSFYSFPGDKDAYVIIDDRNYVRILLG